VAALMADIVAYPVLYGQRHVVLIVDGDRARGAVLCNFLKRSGFHAVSVADGEQAARLIQLGVTIDIVVSDIGIQGAMNGLMLAHWIMDHRPDLPLILVAGSLRIDKTRLCGAEILKTPCAPKRLAERIGETLMKNSLRPVMKPKKLKRARGALLLPFGGR
jgi:DNA-binding NtrC family response regulator